MSGIVPLVTHVATSEEGLAEAELCFRFKTRGSKAGVNIFPYPGHVSSLFLSPLLVGHA